MQNNSNTFFNVKKWLFLFFVILYISNLNAQNRGINYQAVIIDPNPIEIPGNSISGQPLSNGNVCLRFAIVSADGTVEYIETHSTQTDEFGLVNVTIGGSATSSSNVITLGKGAVSEFNSIKWDSKIKSLKVALSFDNCNSFKEIANQPFNYTPYALYAGAVEYKNVDGAPTNVSHFKNDIGYLVPNDLNPLLNDLATTQTNLKKYSTKADSTFKVVNQHLSSLDSTNLVSSEKFKTIDATLQNNVSNITNNTNSINQTNSLLNQQVGNLQNQINGTNFKVSQLPTTYEVLTNKSIDTTLGAASPSNSLYPSQLAVKSYVDVTIADAVATGAPDASTLAKGKVRLAGDLNGTADQPTVPGLALKENLSNKSTNVVTDGNSTTKYPSVKAIKDYVDGQITGNAILEGSSTQYYRGDKTWQTLDKTVVGLANVDNTSDESKPISTATQAALDVRELLANKSNDTLLGNSSTLYPTQKAVKIYVDKQVIGSAIVTGNSTQYYRGDKTWQTLDKTVVGLANVDNTSDESKPISTATQAALDVRELLANKSNDTLLGNSTSKYPTQKAVKSYVDEMAAGSIKYPATAGTEGQLLTSNNTGVAVWQSPIIVHEVTDEFTATAGQIIFQLSKVKSIYSKVKMNINGIRVSYRSYTVVDDILTYIPANNEGAVLVAGDRIQMEYYY